MDDWDKQQFEKAEIIFQENYKDQKIENVEQLSSLIAELMCDYGPDGHCDGNEIIATIVWKLLKEKK